MINFEIKEIQDINNRLKIATDAKNKNLLFKRSNNGTLIFQTSSNTLTTTILTDKTIDFDCRSCDFDKWYNFINVANTSTIDISFTDTDIVIKSENAKTSIAFNTAVIKDLPECKNLAFKVNGSEFKSKINLIEHFADKKDSTSFENENNKIANTLNIIGSKEHKGIKLQALNGFTCGTTTLDIDTPIDDFNISLLNNSISKITKLLSNDDIQISIGDNAIMIIDKQSIFTTLLLGNNFPDLKQFIKVSDTDGIFSINKNEFIDALNLFIASDPKNAILCKVTNDLSMTFLKNQSQQLEINIPINKHCDVELEPFALNPSLAKTAINSINEDVVYINKSTKEISPIIFRTNSIIGSICTMQTKKHD